MFVIIIFISSDEPNRLNTDSLFNFSSILFPSANSLLVLQRRDIFLLFVLSLYLLFFRILSFKDSSIDSD